VSSPVVGICAAIERASWTVWRDLDANVSPRTYSTEVEASGAAAVILPVQDSGPQRTQALLKPLDALILSGGADLDPSSYRAKPGPRTTGYRKERDAFELALAREALDRDLPVLGICRGMQLLNVACGGTLDQDVANAEIHLHTPGEYSDHEVRLAPGSLAARAVGSERVAVRSHHHQGVERLGEGVAATGWSEPDGLIEAIEVPERTFALGVLWHAEEERSGRIVAALCNAVREREAIA
jgi:putative glutamine amidotransferase